MTNWEVYQVVEVDKRSQSVRRQQILPGRTNRSSQSPLIPAETARDQPLIPGAPREKWPIVRAHLSEDASLSRLSLICARVQAAKPNTKAGFSFAWIQKNESVDGLTPISVIM